MEQVKQRDFQNKFSQFKDRKVAVVNKLGELVGVFTPAKESQGEVFSEVFDSIIEENPVNKDVNKKEIADKIVEGDMKRSSIALHIQEEEVDPNSFLMSKDSTDNSKLSVHALEAVGNMKALNENGDIATTGDVNKRVEEEIQRAGFVGTCDICHNPSKELWEHEEEGIERNVCRNCFAVRFDMIDKLEKFLKAKRKLQQEVMNNSTIDKNIYIHPTVKLRDFTPIPKPVKKEKK